MKKFTAILAGLFLMAASAPVAALAADDRPITVSELPAPAQQFIKTYFSGAKVSYATVDGNLMDKDYKVVFTDGRKVEFAKNGEWKEVEAKHAEFPEAVVPQQIRDYLAKNHPDNKVRKIERDRRGYEVKLQSGLELEFNKNFALVKIDD